MNLGAAFREWEARTDPGVRAAQVILLLVPVATPWVARWETLPVLLVAALGLRETRRIEGRRRAKAVPPPGAAVRLELRTEDGRVYFEDVGRLFVPPGRVRYRGEETDFDLPLARDTLAPEGIGVLWTDADGGTRLAEFTPLIEGDDLRPMLLDAARARVLPVAPTLPPETLGGATRWTSARRLLLGAWIVAVALSAWAAR